jgi:hypothetical protein
MKPLRETGRDNGHHLFRPLFLYQPVDPKQSFTVATTATRMDLLQGRPPHPKPRHQPRDSSTE